jgi:hypothetical protein
MKSCTPTITFCHSCHLIDNNFNEFKLRPVTSHQVTNFKNPNCTAQHTSWYFPTAKQKNGGGRYQPLGGFIKWRINFNYDTTTAPVQQSATSPCPSLELASHLSDISLVDNHPTPLLPVVGWNGAVFSPLRHDAAATPQFMNSPPNTSVLFMDTGALPPVMSPLASPRVPYIFALNVKLLRTIEQNQALVQKLHRDHQDQAHLISSLQQWLRQAKQATKKLQAVLRLLEDEEGETLPNESQFYHRKNNNKQFP